MDKKDYEKIEKDVATLELETAKIFEQLSKRSFLTFSPADFGESTEDEVTSDSSSAAKAEETSGSAPATATAVEEEEPKPNLEEELANLDELIGLEEVKEDVRSLINFVKVRNLRTERGLKTPKMSLHLVFMGNPGTGKTTVARILARIYCAIGVLSKGQLVEVDRSGLVAGYVGQTATKTQKVIEQAMGGVLFIDEAYALSRSTSENDFGQEAIDTILKVMEDKREDLIVIVAGYDNLMPQFIASNPGLQSRFNKYFYFRDYTPDELMGIFKMYVRKGHYLLAEDAESIMMDELTRMFNERDDNFGNGRDVRNLFEKIIAVQANRIVTIEDPTNEEIQTITAADVNRVLNGESPEPATETDPAEDPQQTAVEETAHGEESENR